MTLEQLMERMNKDNGGWTVKDGQVYASCRSGLTEDVKQAIVEHKSVIVGVAELIERGPKVNPPSRSLFLQKKVDCERERRRAKYREYLNSDHWKQVRSEALARANYRCQLCKNPLRIQVHHNNYRCLGHETDKDVIVLCRKCHSKHHGVDE